ncbi:hypothetical protein HanIR_Chr11g0516261 [Helianthus annuus]|nr:hypothetical protein HanIR_Chr12g0579191 [Helianthus annuus]KAJ0508351.1 hypothetical protein HanIR_Chr11g0516261 [Helianthus annuus]
MHQNPNLNPDAAAAAGAAAAAAAADVVLEPVEAVSGVIPLSLVYPAPPVPTNLPNRRACQAWLVHPDVVQLLGHHLE